MNQPASDSSEKTDLRPAWYQTPHFGVIVLIVLVGLFGFLLIGNRDRQQTLLVVQAARDLPAYSMLAPSDLVSKTVTLDNPAGLLTDTDAGVGRIVTTFIENGETFSVSELLDAPQVEPDWWIVTLPLTATVAPAPGETVLLIGVDETGESLSVSDQAVALGMEDAEVVVALPPDEGLRVAGYRVGGRQLLVVRVVEP